MQPTPNHLPVLHCLKMVSRKISTAFSEMKESDLPIVP